jgi:hypothetical protein
MECLDDISRLVSEVDDFLVAFAAEPAAFGGHHVGPPAMTGGELLGIQRHQASTAM